MSFTRKPPTAVYFINDILVISPEGSKWKLNLAHCLHFNDLVYQALTFYKAALNVNKYKENYCLLLMSNHVAIALFCCRNEENFPLFFPKDRAGVIRV